MTPVSYPSKQHDTIWHGCWLYTKQYLNFYRIHVVFFTFTPLIVAAIFYASNGATHVPFIDALFLCVSHITVTGLTTVDLSSLTSWQQVILFLLMCMGSPVTVSWLIVYVRRYYFAKKFDHIIESQVSSSAQPALRGKLSRFRRLTRYLRTVSLASDSARSSANGAKVRADMIRRVDGEPRPVDPSGWLENSPKNVDLVELPSSARRDPLSTARRSQLENEDRGAVETDDGDHLSLDNNHVVSSAPSTACDNALNSPSGQSNTRTQLPSHSSTDAVDVRHDHAMTSTLPASTRNRGQGFPRTPTVDFVVSDPDHIHTHGYNMSHGSAGLDTRNFSRGSIRAASPFAMRQAREIGIDEGDASLLHDHLQCDHDCHRAVPGRTATVQSNRSSARPLPPRVQEEDFGGFPLPHVIFVRLFRRFFPRLERRLTRTMTIPYTTTIQSQRGGQTTVLGAKPVPYISFDAIVGRNSVFHSLTRENLEELGGVEYRALNMLLWIVGLYHICVPLIVFTIIAPYISQPRWRDTFHPPMQHRFVSPVWYSLFQVISAYTNTGSSLVDQSMVPFQRAYPEVLTLPFLILAGNTAFPIFLRFAIWLLTKSVHKTSRANETLHFLLDHPRRCFIYLFPSHQTWFLLTIIILLSFIDWFCFLVLDIGNPPVSNIPFGTRFAIGLLQGIAVRAAGFSAIALSVLAPAVKVLYVVMMYISVYPIAMSVRSTNVYEERSLGVFDDGLGEDVEEAAMKERSRAKIWGKYLAAHARNQLSFDMWWLALALFLVCIVERSGLENQSDASWFNIFALVFELTSAYGIVGLSLGIPNRNYSLSGIFKPLSKLILCAVMLRGRHRGLPVAIDRAVLLPAEIKKGVEEEGEANGTEASVSMGNEPGRETCENRAARVRAHCGNTTGPTS